VENLEIGRNGFGSVRWPGLTDVRRLDFDKAVAIEQGRSTLYPGREKHRAVGEELKKEAVVTQKRVKPSRKDLLTAKNTTDLLKARLAKISAEFGGSFQVPHF
jgi:nuclear pore complex protein Nup98-Nup96